MTEQEEAERRHCAKVAEGFMDNERAPAASDVADLIARERADARRQALEEAASNAESYAGGCAAYVEASEFEERDRWWARHQAAEALAMRIRALASPKP